MDENEQIEQLLEEAFDAILTEAEGRELVLNLTDEVQPQDKAG